MYPSIIYKSKSRYNSNEKYSVNAVNFKELLQTPVTMNQKVGTIQI